MAYSNFTKKIQQIPLWWYLVGGLVCLLALYGFNSWMLQRETQTLAQGLTYTQEEYQAKLNEVAYDEETNFGKNCFILNRDYYRSRLDAHKSYQGQTDLRDYYADELLQLDNYHEGVYSLGLGAEGDIGKDVYQGDYLAGKKVLNKSLSQRNLPPQSVRYGTSNWMFPVSVINHLSSYYGILFLVLLFGLPFLFKYEKNQIKFLFTQPTSRRQILLIDSLLFLGRIVGMIFGSLLVSFLLGSLFGEAIPLDYPLLVNEGDFQTMPLGRYLLSVSLLLVLSVFLIFLTCQLFVVLIRNGLISLILTLLLVGYGQGIFDSQNDYSKLIAPYVAPLYMTPQKIFTGLDYQVQKKFEMEHTAWVPGDYLKGEEAGLSLEARADFSAGNIPASRSRFFVADFYAENSHYYAGQSFQRKIGSKLNLKNGTIVLLVNCFFIGTASVISIQRKNF